MKTIELDDSQTRIVKKLIDDMIHYLSKKPPNEIVMLASKLQPVKYTIRELETIQKKLA